MYIPNSVTRSTIVLLAVNHLHFKQTPSGYVFNANGIVHHVTYHILISTPNGQHSVSLMKNDVTVVDTHIFQCLA